MSYPAFPYWHHGDLHALIQSRLDNASLLLCRISAVNICKLQHCQNSPLYIINGQRAVSYSSSVIWNAILLSVRDVPTISTFKRRVKSFYFHFLAS